MNIFDYESQQAQRAASQDFEEGLPANSFGNSGSNWDLSYHKKYDALSQINKPLKSLCSHQPKEMTGC